MGLFQPQRWSKEVSKKNSRRKRTAPAQPVNSQPYTLTYRCGACGRETRVRTVRTPITIFGWTSSGAQPSKPVRPARGESQRWHPPAVMSRGAAATIAAAAALGIPGEQELKLRLLNEARDVDPRQTLREPDK